MRKADERSGIGSRANTTAGFVLLIVIGSTAWFAYRLDDEPMFMDEAAFLSQAYFGDLFITGQWDSPLWLEYAAYDLPPLPKYLINVSLRLHGQTRPARDWALRWYGNPGESRFVTPARLDAARVPSIPIAVLGGLAVFSIGATCGDRRIGLLAAFFLAINPLYTLHARRAMGDVTAEALVLATAAVGLNLYVTLGRGSVGVARIVAVSIGVGALGGLAVLAKLNGGLGLILVAVWGIVAGVASPTARVRIALAGACIGLTALLTFVALNPFVTARPRTLGTVPLLQPKPPDQTVLQRLKEVVDHRVDVSREGQKLFPHDALTTLDKKAAVLVVQGFGRFGPLGPSHSDSTRRFDFAQDWGAIAWLPLVLGGFVAWPAIGAERRRRGDPFSALAIPLGFLTCVVTVGAFLPLAWDRYLLPIQATSGLMAAGAILAAFDRLTRRGGLA